MNKRQEAATKVKEILVSKGIQRLFLKDCVYATWPYESKPKPYTISEVTLWGEDNNVYAWQHWDQSNAGHKLEDFEEVVVERVLHQVEESVLVLKKYRVEIKGEVEVLSTSPSNAMKSINLDCAEVVKVYYHAPENAKIKELEDNVLD